MTVSIRLDPETEAALRDRLRRNGSSLSEFVRDAIREKLARTADRATPYAIGEPLFGRYASGESDRSERRKAILREKIVDKHRRR
jgi:hypothetical protein